MSRGFQLTPLAEQDVRDIVLYVAAEFGRARFSPRRVDTHRRPGERTGSVRAPQVQHALDRGRLLLVMQTTGMADRS